MVTLIRYYMMKAKAIKYRLMVWQFIDRLFDELVKHPEEIEKKIIGYIADAVTEKDKESQTFSG